MKTMKTMLLLLAAVAVLAMACGNGTTPEDGTEEESSPVIPGGIGTGGGGGGSPVTPGITVTNPTRALTPLEGTSPAYSELTVPFTLIVRALQAGDTMTVDLDPTDASTYGLTLAGSPVTLVNGANTLTLVYDGFTAVGAIANVGLDVTTAAAGFPATLTVSVGIYDGAAAARPIPVNQANVAAFNEYARTTGASGGLIKHYKLAGPINLSGVTWIAIGDSTNRFTGSFDGAGYTISNLVINQPATGAQGLFGYINNSTIKNLGLINVNVTGAGSTGSLVGYVLGGTSSVENCYATGSVTGDPSVGGLVGLSYGTIQNCYSAVNVNGSDGNTGGLLGTNSAGSSNVIFCYATGTVVSAAGGGGGWYVGGIVGQGGAENCVALNPSITGPASAWTGRVSGTIGGADNYANSGITAFGGAIGTTTKNGEDVTLVTAGNRAWWNDPVAGGGPWVSGTSGGAGWTVNATKAAASESSPWYWGAGNRPRLWFE